MSSVYSSDTFEMWIVPSACPLISRDRPWIAVTVAVAIIPRMSSTTPYTMSPTWSSATGLKGFTRATRAFGSIVRTPGMEAKMTPSRSYVPSPASNSSATATWSPGRTILGGSMPMPRCAARDGERPCLFIPSLGLDAQEEDPLDVPAVEGERPSEGERVLKPVRDGGPGRPDPAQDERLRLRVVERVHDPTEPEGGVEERKVRVTALGPEGRVHEDRVERAFDLADVGDDPAPLRADATRVAPGDLDRLRVEVRAHDVPRPKEGRRDSEDPVPAPCVEDRATLEVPPAQGHVRDLRGDPRGGRVLLDVRAGPWGGLPALERPVGGGLLLVPHLRPAAG